jgi:hypothetical protein
LSDAVASVAEIVAAWLDSAIEVAELEVVETLAAAEESMAAGSEYNGSALSDLYPWWKTAGKSLPYRPALRPGDTVMIAAGIEDPVDWCNAEWSNWWLSLMCMWLSEGH